ncbi:hypothetical protein HK104_001230 [Borealophlyctis nickersoniae]|nr:hypothetical protein HK104_001230 [Borealophlyctis nickersoniae]
MSALQPPTYIEPHELAPLLRDKSMVPRKDYVIIDVRGDDFANGNIPTAINIPSELFLDRPAAYVERFRDVPKIIFHCALSQVRGPKCATRYYAAFMEGLQETEQKEGLATQQVYILRGGFDGWQRMYRKEADLVEKFNEAYWDDPW